MPHTQINLTETHISHTPHHQQILKFIDLEILMNSYGMQILKVLFIPILFIPLFTPTTYSVVITGDSPSEYRNLKLESSRNSNIAPLNLPDVLIHSSKSHKTHVVQPDNPITDSGVSTLNSNRMDGADASSSQCGPNDDCCVIDNYFICPQEEVKIEVLASDQNSSYDLRPIDIERVLNQLKTLPPSHLKGIQYIRPIPFAGAGIPVCTSTKHGILVPVLPREIRDQTLFRPGVGLGYAMGSIVYDNLSIEDSADLAMMNKISNKQFTKTKFAEYYEIYTADSFQVIDRAIENYKDDDPFSFLNGMLFVASLFTNEDGLRVYGMDVDSDNVAFASKNTIPVNLTSENLTFGNYRFRQNDWNILDGQGSDGVVKSFSDGIWLPGSVWKRFYNASGLNS